MPNQAFQPTQPFHVENLELTPVKLPFQTSWFICPSGHIIMLGEILSVLFAARLKEG